MTATPSKRPLAVVALILVACVALVLWALRDDPPAPPPARTATPPAPVAPARPAQRPVRPRTVDEPSRDVAPEVPAPAPATAVATTPLRRGVVVRVTVLRSGGGPAPGAEVLALDPLGELLSPPAPAVRATRTADPDGRATFEISGGTTVLRLLASTADESALSEVIDVAGGAAERDLTLRLGPATRLAVRAVADGAPVPDAAVVATRFDASETWPVAFRAKTDGSGVARLPGTPLQGKGSGWDVRARAPDGRRGRTWAGARQLAEGDVEVTVELRRVAVVVGRCVRTNGTPVAGARVRWAGLDEFETAGGDGRFELPAADPPRDVVVAEAAADLAPAVRRGVRAAGADVDLGDLVLASEGTIAGVVLDAAGMPVAGATVTASAEGVADVVTALASSGLDGRFTLAPVGEEPQTVAASVDGSGATRPVARLRDVRAGATDVRLVLDGAASVVVRFLDAADRTPVVVGSVKLTARPVGRTDEEAAWAWSGAGIDAVRFQPDHVGTFDVAIEIPGYEVGVAQAVEVAPDRELRIDVLFRRGPE